MKNPCPYNPTKPTYESSYFVGREEQLNLLIDGFSRNLTNTFVVIGGRRTGKSSFLIKTQDTIKKLNNENVISIYFDLLPEKSDRDFYKRLIELVYREAGIPYTELAEYGYLQFEECLKKFFSNGKSLVILFDEIEAVAKDEWAKTFFSNLRHLLNNYHYHLSIVVAVFDWQLIQRTLLPNWAIDFKKLRLEPLDLNDVSKLTSFSAASLTFSDEAVVELHRQTGGHPYLLHKILQELCCINPPKNNISLVDVNKIVKWFLSDDDTSFGLWFRGVFNKLEDRIVLKELGRAEGPVSKAQFKDAVLDTDELELSLDRCVESCLVTVDKEKNYYLSCLMFQQWLRERVLF